MGSVTNWSLPSDFFDKDFILVPIPGGGHFGLCVIVRPRLVKVFIPTCY